MNFRPVWNLAFVSKVIEKAVSYQLIEHVDSNDLGEPLQSASKSLHNTETALLKVQDDILNTIDQHQTVMLCCYWTCLQHLTQLTTSYCFIDSLFILALEARPLLGLPLILLDIASTVCYYQRCGFFFLQCDAWCPSRLGTRAAFIPCVYYPIRGHCSKHGMMFHFYADDSQIYCSFDSNTPELVTASRLEACVKDVSGWMPANKLKLSTLTRLVLNYFWYHHNSVPSPNYRH